jgi:FlaA1/EpsC-like NDP-sugar epimerase
MRSVPISRRIVAQVLIDLVLVSAANLTAFLLKYDPPRLFGDPFFLRVVWTLPVLIALRLTALGLFHLYRIRWRYMSVFDLKSVALATSLSTIAFHGFLWLVGLGEQADYSWGMQVIDWLLTICLLSGVRIAYRHLSDRMPLRSTPEPKPRRRALIVGAGDAGETVVRELLRRPQDGIVPIGFVDDDHQKRRTRIHGLPVLGTTHEIAAVASKIGADIILLAIPSAPGKVLRDIVGRCEKIQARLCIVPSLPDMLSGTSRLGPVRDVNIEDLLRRPAVQTDIKSVAGYLSGQRVLVTGAGGSIGSELCRQIAALNPARLLLLGRGENSIFEIEQELIRDFGIAPIALIGDVRDRARLEEIFLAERPTVVFHAAAHKHVPLMEANPSEAIKNNVLGTRNIAEIAAAFGVRKFLFVSTDKAVHPSSVMGATKRIGEMIVQNLARSSQAPDATRFAVVRFGNVLGSRGSVIPTMRRQIAAGGPVTVTDPQMTRYFMTIPEAVQLILQAGAIGKGGEIFLLDMGEPIRILDLACDLIRLSGLRPNVDIPIAFTGARPGEKIEEQLTYSEEEKLPTQHKKITVSKSCMGTTGPVLSRAIDRLIRLAIDGERDGLREEILRVAQMGTIPETVFAGPQLRTTAEETLQGVPNS